MTQTIGPAPAQPHGGVATLQPAVLEPRDKQRIDATITRLLRTESGRDIAQFLADGRVEIEVFEDEEFSRRFPGAGAIFDPRTNDIVMPRRALDSSSLITTIAHEGKHAVDHATGSHWALESLKLVGGTVGDGAAALLRLDNPVTGWLDSITARQNEKEVAAYRLQAEVAHELGRNESSWSLGQAADGTPLPEDEIRRNVAMDDLYRMSSGRRLVLGSALGLGATSMAAWAVQSAATALKPGSFLAKHAWPVFVAGGALAGAFVLGDQQRSRKLDSGMFLG
jgi:hypothetical protein